MLNFFSQFPEVTAVMSEKTDGSMKIFTDNNLNMENREKFFKKIGIYGKKIIAAEIVHGNVVKVANKESVNFVHGADALITRDHDVFLSVTVADCIPVYFYESQQKIIAIAHCGWRGILDGIIENTIQKILQLDGNIESVYVAMGPGINQCHFEIQEDVLQKFEKYPKFILRQDGKFFVDLKGIVIEQLKKAGVLSENIENSGECTMENTEKYFSFRRDKPKKVEVMMALIGIN